MMVQVTLALPHSAVGRFSFMQHIVLMFVCHTIVAVPNESMASKASASVVGLYALVNVSMCGSLTQVA